MAALTHGPRLGAPSPSGFSVWIRADGAATASLETRVTGASAWTAQSSTAIDLAQGNSAVLFATGLVDTTAYDYRVLLDSVEVVSSSTVTMPSVSGGRFVVYHLSDGHANHIDAYGRVLTHWTATYAAAGIPAFIVQTGDFYQLDSGDGDAVTAYANKVLPELAEITNTLTTGRRFPIVFMWDDHDFAGNNSAGAGYVPAFASAPSPIAEAQALWDWTWREAPQPSPPSRSYSFEIAGVPFLVVDQRSQRTQSGSHPGDLAGDARTGDEALGSYWTAIGVPQRDWLASELRRVSGRGLIFFVHGTTLVDGGFASGTVGAGSAVRDSVGLWHKAERNDYLRRGLGAVFAKNNLVVLSGDDHRNSVFARQIGEVSSTLSGVGAPRFQPRAGAPIGLLVREFVVSSGTSGPVGFSTTIFGSGELGETLDATPSIVCWDITSADGGERVTARATYIVAVDGTTLMSTAGQTAGLAMDYWYENGYCAPVAIASTEMSQLHPASNAPGGVTFERSYVGDLDGAIHRRRYVSRDYLNRLVETSDEDDLDAAELRAITQIRHEQPPRVPS